MSGHVINKAIVLEKQMNHVFRISDSGHSEGAVGGAWRELGFWIQLV